MPKGTNQKLKLAVLKQLLEENTDEDHPMTVPEMIAALEQRGVPAERKSIYGDLIAMQELNVDIQCHKGRTPGWFVGERLFQLPELKLLVDAVQSCRFITRKKSDALIRKLESLASRHQARMLQRQVYVAGRIKTMNESIYYNIDKLHTAIAGESAITFRYFEYNMQKERVFRREGKRYCVSPYGLIWDSENYYLVGWDHTKEQMRHYRVDKMAELAVTCLPRQGDASCQQFDIAAYGQKHFGMFSGREGQIKLRCKQHLVGVVLDRFGQDAMLVPDGEDAFTVTVQAVVSTQFFGWIFGLGPGVSIVSPPWAAQLLRDQLDAIRALYP